MSKKQRSITEEVDLFVNAKKKLEAIAKGADAVRLTQDEAAKLLDHMGWLSKERDELLSSLPYDD